MLSVLLCPQHKNSAHNNDSVPFTFTAESQRKAEFILAKFPPNYQQSAVMPLLTLAQEQNDNWLPLTAMNYVADLLDMPRIRVYEVATFYSMYNREPVGRYHIQLCGTTPCQLCGSEKLSEAIEQKYGIHNGETSADGMFTLTEVECLGACANAPMIQINHHEFYENLTPKTVIDVLEKLKRGEKVEAGPQNGQWRAAGPMGKTTLKEEKDEEVKKRFRDIDALMEQVKKDQEKAKADAAAKAAQDKGNAAGGTSGAPKK
jgi:NADH dehydrogenase (ubiquinone) flavoprotein 2